VHAYGVGTVTAGTAAPHATHRSRETLTRGSYRTAYSGNDEHSERLGGRSLRRQLLTPFHGERDLDDLCHLAEDARGLSSVFAR
jgi:hypothetical protein